ncbi:TIGR02757 family protein [Treponema zioleckii]|uniref:TIGR02757 family protein n=1 Tax=Treponema zioleckii TaxID=331680 RepID=UPI001F5B29F9|nr:TIGR02757 family protein [Treponema zioleckii]
MLEEKLIEKLRSLAQKYETADFLLKDPSQFMHRYKTQREQEIVAFIAANLAFGRREQILQHVELILNNMSDNPQEWILQKKYEIFFPQNEKSFYRMYSNNSMRLFFDSIRIILEKSESLGDFFKNEYKCTSQRLTDVIAGFFPKECNLLPHSPDSAAKKLNMFLRWMVRTESPVDLGLWTWYSKKDLLIPLDTHVMQEATNFKIIEPNSKGKIRSANLKTAIELTDRLKEVFPDDPVKADFALFGLGVDTERNEFNDDGAEK